MQSNAEIGIFIFYNYYRYQQHLDPMMVSEWTLEEEQKLYWLHN